MILSGTGKLTLIAAWLALFVLNSPSQRPAAPDLIIINAKVRTMTSPGSTADALAVTGNRISAVGTIKRISSLAGPNTKIVDAKGQLLLPGFNDAHAHFMAIGNIFSSLDLRNAATEKDAAEKIRKFVQFMPKGRWILGGHWGMGDWQPTRATIDPQTPEHPVFIYHSDAKTAFANGLALKLAGIGRDTSAPGSEILKDPSGEPTGIIRGTAIDLVRRAVPAGHTRDWPAIAETATNYAASLGVTSVTDTQSDDNIDVYRELEKAGKLKTRIYDCVSLFVRKRSEDRAGIDRDPDKMVRAGCVKGFSDGDKGEAANLLKYVREADKQGFQVLLHAIGPAANSIVLDTFEKAAANSPRRDRRFRIEHAHNASAITAARFKASGVIASVQPYLFYGGPTKNETFRDLAAAKVPLAFGADAPFVDLNPLLGIQAAVQSLDGEKDMSIFDAVRAYTAGSAHAEFQERAKGTLEPGKLADIVMLSSDIFTIPPEKITDAAVTMTVVNGRIVYQADALTPGNLQK